MYIWQAIRTSKVGLAVTLMIGAGLFRPSAAQAQTVLSTFFNDSGYYWERGSYDDGHNWFGWELLPHYDACHGVDFYVTGSLSAAADQAHSLWMVAKGSNGYIMLNSYDGGSHSWNQWCPIWFQGLLGPGGAWVNARYYTWIDGSSPTISSSGPGKFDIFLVARRDDGALTVLHGWTADTLLIFDWEPLGTTGLFSGTPAAVSWSSGRTDVFVRAADHGLVHKWWENGHWSNGWEDMGVTVNSSPTVVSQFSGELDVFFSGPDYNLWQKKYLGGHWAGLYSYGIPILYGTSPAAASRGSGNIQVFYASTDWLWHQFSSSNGVWSPPTFTADSWASDAFATYWVP
jgi:hypothetical protein